MAVYEGRTVYSSSISGEFADTYELIVTSSGSGSIIELPSDKNT